jgi:[acyl-carrier-protein] S-malonyltransferase
LRRAQRLRIAELNAASCRVHRQLGMIPPKPQHPMTRIFMFPGQSSRYPGMLERIIDAWQPAEAIVADASEVLGRDLRVLYREGQRAFERNQDVQVGVFLASYLHRCALEAAGITAEASLGLSLGEYNHLVHIGALEFADALRLVDARGRVYDQGPEGMMASVQPASVEDLEPLLEQARAHGEVTIANYNSPSQQVVAGKQAAVEATLALCEEELFAQPVVIERRIPMHTPLFRPVADQLRPYLEQAPWQQPSLPYMPNVTAIPIDAARPEDLVEMLARHVYSPVLWRDSIDRLIETNPSSIFVEVGPSGVLYSLLQKRWHAVAKHRSDSPDDLSAHLASLKNALGQAG